MVRADAGRLDAEYALFDTGEVVLQAADRLTVREEGYLTTALDARSRLATAGITAELAAEAARALPRDVIVALAHSDSATRLAPRLGPSELFDGSVYFAEKREYAGAWLDLAELARATGMRDAAAAIQALYLAAILSEVDDAAPVHLSTTRVTRELRLGERTFHRPSISAAKRLPKVFSELRMSATRAERNEEMEHGLRLVLLRGVRERASAAVHAQSRKRIESLENALAADGRMTEQQVAGPHDDYLRVKAALERGDGQLKNIAEMLSGLSNPEKHEITLLAARAWLAAGDEPRAKEYAQRIADDPDAPPSTRLSALDLLELPSPMTKRVAIRQDQGIPGASRPPYAIEDAPAIVMPPPARVAKPTPLELAPTYGLPEVVESMPLPTGLGEEMLAVGTVPTNAMEARIAMTRMARELARDYRTIYRTILKTDVISLEAMQRHLRRRFAEGQKADADVAMELHRHGALLSEILARRLGGLWIDVAPTDVGYWAMLIPSQTRIWPIGRVFRFFSPPTKDSNRERDLVGYFLELEGMSQR